MVKSKDKEYLKSTIKNIPISLENSKDEIISSFISYYGEEYKNIITHRLNNTEFIFYVNKRKKYLNFRNLLHKKPLKSNYEEIKKKIVYTSLKTDDEDFKLFTEMAVEDTLTCEKGMIINGEYKRIIYIPLAYANDNSLIHEMVHAVCDQELLVTEEGKVISKVGLTNSDNDFSKNKYLEEVLTEIDAKNIVRDIRSKGIDIIDSLYLSSEYRCVYDILSVLTKEFYQTYRDNIINARLTMNFRKFKNLLGDKEFEEYEKLIYDFFTSFPKDHEVVDYVFMKNKILNDFKENTDKVKKLTL